MARFIIAGDFCPRERVAKLMDENNYEVIFQDVKYTLKHADYSLVNLEAPIVDEEIKPIEKAGPNLKCNSKTIDALKYIGFKCVTLANNHFKDYGESGVLSTICKLEGSGINYVGGGKNKDCAAKILYVNVNGQIIAIINCCEHEYSIATRDQAGSNALNPISLYYNICNAKRNADYVLVIVHGGIEHFQFPTPRMQETYRFFIDAGADAVVNGHQHCFSGYEIYNKKNIFYGLGNFCFDKINYRNDNWNEGYMVELNTDNNDFKLLPYTQCDNIPSVKMMSGIEKEKFYEKISKLNQIISDPLKVESQFNEFVANSKREFTPFHPYTNRYLKGLFKRGLIPSFISKKKLMTIHNKIECESHLERLKCMLRDN